MEDIVKQGLLYDFYGELLTEHQKKVYETLVYDDLTISEIATEFNISRQAASDLIKRINKILKGYEDKLGLVSKFESIRHIIESMPNLSEEEKKELLKEL